MRQRFLGNRVLAQLVRVREFEGAAVDLGGVAAQHPGEPMTAVRLQPVVRLVQQAEGDALTLPRTPRRRHRLQLRPRVPLQIQTGAAQVDAELAGGLAVVLRQQRPNQAVDVARGLVLRARRDLHPRHRRRHRASELSKRNDPA